jgi:signal transduction histidine kinase
MGTLSSQDRLRALVEAGMALTSESTLEALLQRLLAAAAELTDARYAALGVIDPAGGLLERFVTHGIDAETHAAIGDLPQVRGILGVLLHESEPLRLHDLSADSRSVGFPPNHPPMKSFLGVPILLRGVAYGNLYLTEKAGGEDFTQEDEEVVTLLAAQAAVAIENARLYESATRWLRQLEALNEVANALVSEMELPRLLDMIARELRDLIGAKLVTIAVPASESTLRIEGVAGVRADELVGAELRIDRSKHGRIFERRRSERVDSVLDDPEADQDFARRGEIRTGLFVPLLVREQALGVIGIHDREGPDPRFTDQDQLMAEAFAARAAVAVELSSRVAQDALRRVVAAQELERTRLARELHDETGQALTSILLGLKRVEESQDHEEARAAARELRSLVVDTLQDVRRLAVELRPKALDDFGLVPALERLAESVSESGELEVVFEAALRDDRLPGELETALYRIVQEALTNVVKHARAGKVSVSLAQTGGRVTAVVEDDGRGFESGGTGGAGLGLVGMRERLALLGGKLAIESTEAAGTTLVAEVPV